MPAFVCLSFRLYAEVTCKNLGLLGLHKNLKHLRIQNFSFFKEKLFKNPDFSLTATAENCLSV